jgi:hypothetical protein
MHHNVLATALANKLARIISLERRLVDTVDELVGLEGRPAAVIKPAPDGAASLSDGLIE